MLRNLGVSNSLPWCVYGDFNEIMYNSQKIRAISRDERRIEMFCEALLNVGLTDMGCGSVFYLGKGAFSGE